VQYGVPLDAPGAAVTDQPRQLFFSPTAFLHLFIGCRALSLLDGAGFQARVSLLGLAPIIMMSQWMLDGMTHLRASTAVGRGGRFLQKALIDRCSLQTVVLNFLLIEALPRQADRIWPKTSQKPSN